MWNSLECVRPWESKINLKSATLKVKFSSNRMLLPFISQCVILELWRNTNAIVVSTAIFNLVSHHDTQYHTFNQKTLEHTNENNQNCYLLNPSKMFNKKSQS